jgi:hypothetical protein
MHIAELLTMKVPVSCTFLPSFGDLTTHIVMQLEIWNGKKAGMRNWNVSSKRKLWNFTSGFYPITNLSNSLLI